MLLVSKPGQSNRCALFSAEIASCSH